MLNKKMYWLKFKFAVLRVKYSRMKLMECSFKILKSCIRELDKIGVPISEEENEAMKKLLSVYDNGITELNKSVDIYRKRVSK